MFSAVTRTYREAFSDLPKPVWLLALVLLVNCSGAMVLPFLTLFFTEERGYTALIAGQFLSAYGIGGIIGNHLGGRLSGSLGAIRVQVLSFITTAGGVLVLLVLVDRSAIILGMLLFGICAEMFRPAYATLVAELATAEERPRAYALNRLAASLGLGIGPAVGGVLATHDFSFLFYANATASMAAAVLLAALFRHRFGTVTAESPKSSSRHRTASPWQDRQFLTVLGGTVLLATIFFQFNTTLPLYLENIYRLSTSEIGALFAMNALCVALFEMVIVHRASRFQLLKAVGLGALLLCVGFAILPYGSGLAIAVTGMLLLTFGEMLVLPLTMTYAANRATSENRGAYMGIYTMTFSLAFVIAPALGTFLYGIHEDIVWHACAVVGPILGGLFWKLSAKRSPTK